LDLGEEVVDTVLLEEGISIHLQDGTLPLHLVVGEVVVMGVILLMIAP
jgi:hypothetical protein